LGEAATDEVMAAWTEAYQALSEVFIHREHDIYVDEEKKPQLLHS
jgi:nitric oxide dioxygenase